MGRSAEVKVERTEFLLDMPPTLNAVPVIAMAMALSNLATIT
jgi:hypothetical protein